ncbi:hypothetical protein R1flu_000308 [Riccia fluitans]|uniref:Uncharacterized protein n=1 Tax=Riccia fluitans TaxID=41844 RepID=A0ABD1Y0A5_9MARC
MIPQPINLDTFISNYLQSFVNCPVTHCKVVTQVQCPSYLTQSRLELLVQGGNVPTIIRISEQGEGNPLSIWVNSDQVPLDYFSRWFLTSPGPTTVSNVKILEFHVAEVVVHRAGVNTWGGKVRLKLAWDDKTVVIGNLTTDSATGFLPRLIVHQKHP